MTRLFSSSTSAKRQALRRSFARGGIPGAMSSPPTVSAMSQTSAITGTIISPVTSPSSFAFAGGSWAVAGATYPNSILYRATVFTTSSGVTGGLAAIVEYYTDASAFEIYIKGSSYRVLVDGQYVSLSPSAAPNDGNLYYEKYDFGSRKPSGRKITIEGQVSFGGIKVANTDKVWAAGDGDAPRLIVLGDSITEGNYGSGTTYYGAGFANVLGRALGIRDTWASGVGGTGYINTVSGTKYNFGQRVAADVIARSPDIVLVAGGINDAGSTQAAIQAAASSLFDTIRAGLPNALVAVAGPFAPTSGFNTYGPTVACRDAIQAAVGTRADFLFIDNIAEKWMVNEAIYTSGDNTHPTILGHEMYAGCFANAIRGWSF